MLLCVMFCLILDSSFSPFRIIIRYYGTRTAEGMNEIVMLIFLFYTYIIYLIVKITC